MQLSEPQLPHLTVVNKPSHLAYGRPLTEILADLAKPVPQRFLAQRRQGGTFLTYSGFYSDSVHLK